MRISFTEKDKKNYNNLYSKGDGLDDYEREQVFLSNILYGKAPKYLYLIQQCKSDIYKIGITNNLLKRFQTLQTGNPITLKYIFVVEADFLDFSGKEIVYFERFLHRNYHSKRIKGEWFSLSCIDVCKIYTFLTDSYYGPGLEAYLPITSLIEDVIKRIEK